MLGVGAVLLVALVVLLPGLLLQHALSPRGDVLVRVAAAAPVGLGVVWTITTALHVVGLPVSAATLLPALTVVVAASLLLARRRPEPGTWRSPGLDRWDVAALALGASAVVVLTWVSTSALSLAVPNDDGAIHSWMTARIAATASVSPEVALSTDAYRDLPGASFYPLVMHVVAAVVHQLGVPVATALNAVWLLLLAVSLPTGMFALARTTFPSARRVPATTAVVFGLMPLLPYNALSWGGIAFIVGLAVTPAVVALCLTAATSSASRGDAVVIGVALVGIAFSHTSEVVVVALVAGGLLLGDGRLRSCVVRSSVLRTLLLAAAVGVVVGLPWLSAIRGGGAERAVLELPDKTASETLVIWVLYLLGPLLPAMAAAALVGLVVATRMRSFGGWWFVSAAASALVVTTVVAPSALRLLTLPWYGLPDRVSATLLYPSGLAVAVGCWWCVRLIVRRLGAAPGLPPAAGAATTRLLAVSLVGGLVLGGMVVDCWQKAQGSYVGPDGAGTGASLTTPSAAAAFDELARLVPPGGRVLNEFQDGSSWMYSDAGVAPLMASKPDAVGGDRLYLLEHAAELTSDPAAAAAAREWDVAYAYVRDRRFPQYQDGGDPPLLQVDLLVAGGWTVVWQQDDVTLLEAPPV